MVDLFLGERIKLQALIPMLEYMHTSIRPGLGRYLAESNPVDRYLLIITSPRLKILQYEITSLRVHLVLRYGQESDY